MLAPSLSMFPSAGEYTTSPMSLSLYMAMLQLDHRICVYILCTCICSYVGSIEAGQVWGWSFDTGPGGIQTRSVYTCTCVPSTASRHGGVAVDVHIPSPFPQVEREVCM